MKSLILILLWASSMFFFTSYARARDSDAAVQVGKEPLALERSFKNLNSERCIGVDRASTSSGAYIKQFTCDASDNQTWLLNLLPSPPAPPGRYTLQNKKSALAGRRMCMGVDRASRKVGANIRQFPCDSSLNQTWFFMPQHIPQCRNPDHVCIINEKSKLCVGVNHASKDNGAQLKQFNCDDRANQLWTQR